MQSKTPPPVLPLYKVAANAKSGRPGKSSFLVNVAFVVIPIILIALFIASIYMGTAYLEDHIQSKEDNTGFFNIGLPNTRNEIKKWSMQHLHGIDLTALGPPIVKGNSTYSENYVYKKLTNTTMYRDIYERNIKSNLVGLLNRTQSLNLNYNAMNSFNYFRDKSLREQPPHSNS